jgi:hypothetical protein
VISDGLRLDAIRPQRLPGARMKPDGSFDPIFTAVAAGPEVSQYLIDALDEAIALLREALPTAPADLQPRIEGFIKTV